MRWDASALFVIVGGTGCSLFVDTDALTGGARTASSPDGGAEGGSVLVDASPPRETGSTVPSEAGAEPSDGGGDGDPLSSAVLADGPIAYFRFAETAGISSANVVPGGKGTCLVSNTAVWGATGVAGTRGLELATSETLVTISGLVTDLGKSYSIELWLRKTTAANGLLVTHADDPFNVGGQITGKNLMWWNDSKVRTETWNKYQLLSYTLMDTGSPVDTWVHVVYGFDAAKMVDFTLVDGVPSTGGASPSNRPSVSAAIVIGHWQGYLDEVAIYDKALTQERAAAHRALAP